MFNDFFFVCLFFFFFFFCFFFVFFFRFLLLENICVYSDIAGQVFVMFGQLYNFVVWSFELKATNEHVIAGINTLLPKEQLQAIPKSIYKLFRSYIFM